MKKTAFLALASLALAGCTTHADGTQSTNKTAVGAGIGALAGGIFGNRASGDHRARNTVIGAAAGAAVGGGIGYMMDRRNRSCASSSPASARSTRSRSSGCATICSS
jgi:uncharacterized membrane protein YebE (DUF533 family)